MLGVDVDLGLGEGFWDVEAVGLGVSVGRGADLRLVLGTVGDFGVEVGIDDAFGFWVSCGASARGFWVFWSCGVGLAVEVSLAVFVVGLTVVRED